MRPAARSHACTRDIGQRGLSVSPFERQPRIFQSGRYDDPHHLGVPGSQRFNNVRAPARRYLVTQCDIRHTPCKFQIRHAGKRPIHVLFLQRIGSLLRSIEQGVECGCVGVGRNNSQCRALLGRRTRIAGETLARALYHRGVTHSKAPPRNVNALAKATKSHVIRYISAITWGTKIGVDMRAVVWVLFLAASVCVAASSLNGEANPVLRHPHASPQTPVHRIIVKLRNVNPTTASGVAANTAGRARRATRTERLRSRCKWMRDDSGRTRWLHAQV